MNKKSKSYITAIVFTILAVSLVIYQIQLHYGINLFNKEKVEEIISYAEEKNNSTKDNSIDLSSPEEEQLKILGLTDKFKSSYNYPDKEDIHFKMINAVDNFKTAKGEYIDFTPPYETTPTIHTFVIDTENKSSTITLYDEAQGEGMITFIHRNNKTEVFNDNDNDNTYRERPDESNYTEKPVLVRPLKLFLNGTLTRNDLGYLNSNELISNHEIYGYLFFYEDWNYVESTFLGRDAYKIDGIIDPSFSQMLQGKFSLFVDKETGIILQFISFNENGGIKYKLECTKLEINTPIDESIYNKDTSEYTKK